jgi:heat shock protein HtpX
MGVQIIDRPGNSTEQWLVETVRRQAQQAGIGMPEVGVFQSPDPNAFATGMRRNDALVAVSTGLLQSMSADEVEAVLGHEISHVSNGDMVTMGLLQGVVNTFVIFLSRVIGHVVDRVVFKTERGYGPAYFITSIVAQIFLSILATMIVMWFSRHREFRADAGGASLAGRGKMIGALQALQRAHEPKDLPGEFAAFGISGGLGAGMKKLFMSHPPLEERIAALRSAQ